LKRYISYLFSLFLATLLLQGCGKDNGGGETPPPDPPPQPPVQDGVYAKKELRGAWIASVFGIDWPVGKYDEVSQKKLYTDYLDGFVAANLNAVFMQIRPTADAFYESEYEPWSRWITGVAGKDPGYDVLKFMIDEAHDRGLEFHAWINPFRITTDLSQPLDPRIPVEWKKDYPGMRVYNPAIPEVHQRIADIVNELITKFDIDGIHLDDYFYPDIGNVNNLNDADDFAKYGAGYANITAFRRANVDKVVQKIRETALKANPRVVFSVSPTANISYNLNSLFADVEKWCREGWIDFVVPQVYQALGSGNSNFEALLSNWVGAFNTKVGCVVGLALYRVENPVETTRFTVADFDRMFQLTSSNQKIHGSIMYNTSSFAANRGGVIDMLKAKYFKNPAVRPAFGRKTEADPVVPANVTISGSVLSWTTSAGLSSVVYFIPAGATASQVVAITKSNSFTVTAKGTYFVTTFNRDNTESEKSKEVNYN
jgi:uncharacterized lipoprotein YddW (UPF0748 family)